MDFIKPEYKIVYSKLSTNNNLIKYLTELGALITTDDYYEHFGKNSNIDPKIYVSKYNKAVLETLAEFFLTNETKIKKESITSLISSNKNKNFRNELKTLLGFDEDEVLLTSAYREIFYSYKNSYLENFFQNNWRNFIPETDELELDDNEVAMSFIDAITKEYDKLDEIITNTKQFRSYEEIPDEYLNHLSQLLGLEQKTFYIDNSQLTEFRILAANAIEVYKRKGTYASFELLFRLFGFDVNIEEYYFDRRMYYAHNEENKETITLNKTTYKFYLTKTNPTLNSFDNFEVNEIVTDTDMTERYSVKEFNDLVADTSLECVLGYDDYYTVYYDSDEFDEKGERIKLKKSVKYDGNVYKYFKTNLVTIRPRVIGNKSNLTASQIRTIKKFLEFLVPYFWEVHLNVNPTFDNDAEKLTVNGHRGQHDEDGVMVNDEGFRLLDSETWILKDETLLAKLEDPNISKYEKSQITAKLSAENARLAEITKDFTLYYEYCDDYIVLHDKDVIFTDLEFRTNVLNEKSGFRKSIEDTYKAVNGIEILSDEDKEIIEKQYNALIKKFARATDSEGKTFWIKDLVKPDRTLNEKYIYYNSIGEKNGDRIHKEPNGDIINYNVIMEPICKKIISINSTKYWGKIFDATTDKPATRSISPVYPIWIEDYSPVFETNTSDRYFFPTISAPAIDAKAIRENHLYIPKYSNYDLYDQWESLKKDDLDLFGFEGNTLKKNFLDTKEETKIDWIAKGDDLFKAIIEKNIYSNKDGESFFKKEPRKVPNMTWKKCNLTLLKDRSEIVSLEKEIWNELLVSKDANDIIQNNSVLNIKDLTSDILVQIKAYLTQESYKIICDNLKKIATLQNNILLEDFIKTHKVINYDYTKNKLMKFALPSFGAEENKFAFETRYYNDLYFQNSYCLNFTDDDIEVYKLVVEKNSLSNKFYFKETLDGLVHGCEIDIAIGSNIVNNFEIKSVDNLVYVDREELIDETHTLILKDNQTFYVIKRDNKYIYNKVCSGTIFYTKDENEEINHRYIATMGSTNVIEPSVGNSYVLEDGEMPNKLNGFACIKNDEGIYEIWQNKQINIKQGQTIYMPETGELFEIMFNGISTASYVDYDKYLSLESKHVTFKGTDTEKVGYYADREFDKNFVLGVKSKELTGKIINNKGVYTLMTDDEYYKGVSVDDDCDNYILNNYERIASWDVLDGCKTDYLKDNHINRPVRELTDKVFDEALICTLQDDKNNGKKIVANILNELVGNRRILTDKELIKRSKDE